ncbi:MAG: hypothetical protein M1816_004132 [Peltula sp. TS41687]|nr:MAG: hypothetical protein M1816_004132 [Peltula sp. TS41687]
MANTLAHKHYLRALSQWPKDLLRPEASFQAAMRRRLDRRIKPSQQQQQLQQDGKKSTGRAVLLDLNEKTELEQVNALYSLLEDRYKQKVCMPPRAEEEEEEEVSGDISSRDRDVLASGLESETFFAAHGGTRGGAEEELVGELVE